MTDKRDQVVAIVDDDPAVLASLIFLLEAAGYRVEAFDSSSQFLAEAQPDRYACLVLDQELPGISGIELLRHARRSGATAPALLVTNAPVTMIAANAAALGIAGVLRKPLLEDDLIAVLDAALRQP